MSDKLKEFARESLKGLLARLPAEKRLEGLSLAERLQGLSAEEVLRALPPETVEAIARHLKAQDHSAKPD